MNPEKQLCTDVGATCLAADQRHTANEVQSVRAEGAWGTRQMTVKRGRHRVAVIGIFVFLMMAAACAQREVQGREPSKRDTSSNATVASIVPLPLLPNSGVDADFAVGAVAPQPLLDLGAGKAAAILLSAPDCDVCAKVEPTLMSILKPANLRLIVADSELSSAVQPDADLSLLFISASGTIVGREVPSDNGVFDNARINWLARASQSIGTVPPAPVDLPDKPPAQFVGVTDKAVVILSSESGAVIDTIASGGRFEGAWSIGAGFYGISECCEPAAGRLWRVRPGKQLDRSRPAFDASSARGSPDGNWVLTASSYTKVWPSTNPFTSKPATVRPPGSVPADIAWLHDRLGVVMLWPATTGGKQAAIESVELASDLAIAGRRFNPVPAGTVGVAPLNDGTIVLAINGANASLARFSPKTGKIKNLADLPNLAKSVALDPSGSRLLVLMGNGAVRLFDTTAWSGKNQSTGPLKAVGW